MTEQLLNEKLRHVLLEKFELRLQSYISHSLVENTSIEFVYNDVSELWCAELRAFFYKNHMNTVTKLEYVPKTWWNHFKYRWFPKWLVELFPIRYREIGVVVNNYKVCPHLDVAYSDEPVIHLDWLAEWEEPDED